MSGGRESGRLRRLFEDQGVGVQRRDGGEDGRDRAGNGRERDGALRQDQVQTVAHIDQRGFQGEVVYIRC